MEMAAAQAWKYITRGDNKRLLVSGGKEDFFRLKYAVHFCFSLQEQASQPDNIFIVLLQVTKFTIMYLGVGTQMKWVTWGHHQFRVTYWDIFWLNDQMLFEKHVHIKVIETAMMSE